MITFIIKYIPAQVLLSSLAQTLITTFSLVFNNVFRVTYLHHFGFKVFIGIVQLLSVQLHFTQWLYGRTIVMNRLSFTDGMMIGIQITTYRHAIRTKD